MLDLWPHGRLHWQFVRSSAVVYLMQASVSGVDSQTSHDVMESASMVVGDVVRQAYERVVQYYSPMHQRDGSVTADAASVAISADDGDAGEAYYYPASSIPTHSMDLSQEMELEMEYVVHASLESASPASHQPGSRSSSAHGVRGGGGDDAGRRRRARRRRKSKDSAQRLPAGNIARHGTTAGPNHHSNRGEPVGDGAVPGRASRRRQSSTGGGTSGGDDTVAGTMTQCSTGPTNTSTVSMAVQAPRLPSPTRRPALTQAQLVQRNEQLKRIADFVVRVTGSGIATVLVVADACELAVRVGFRDRVFVVSWALSYIDSDR